MKPILNGYDFAKNSRFIKGFTRGKFWYRISGELYYILNF